MLCRVFSTIATKYDGVFYTFFPEIRLYSTYYIGIYIVQVHFQKAKKEILETLILFISHAVVVLICVFFLFLFRCYDSVIKVLIYIPCCESVDSCKSGE